MNDFPFIKNQYFSSIQTKDFWGKTPILNFTK